MKLIMVASLMRDHGKSLKGRVVLTRSDTLYLITGLKKGEGLEVHNLEDMFGSVPQGGLIIPLETSVAFPDESALSRIDSRLKRIRAEYGLNNSKQKDPDSGKDNNA